MTLITRAQVRNAMKLAKGEKAYDTALATRNFEISLFWQRSIFFWGFIGAAFVAYAALRDAHSGLSLVIVCFGLVCSVAWAWVNRGSKYWQEAWEAKVERSEDAVTGALFQVEEPLKKGNGWWLAARRYSVSKLSIAMSDYTTCLWLALLAWEGVRMIEPARATLELKRWGATAWVIFTVGYCAALLIAGRSTPRKSTIHRETDETDRGVTQMPHQEQHISEPGDPSSSTAKPGESGDGHYSVYEEHAKTLRTWLVAYGIGGPVLILSKDSIWTKLGETGLLRPMAELFLAGVVLQVLLSAVNKSAMWACYYGEIEPAYTITKRYKFGLWLSELYIIDFAIDLASMGLFAYATYLAFLALVP
jgi:hypothetical protein